MHDDRDASRAVLRRTTIRVMIVQIVTLLVLWLIQSRYHLP